MDIDKTLVDRGALYGPFSEHSKVVQSLLRAIQSAPNYDKLSDVHLESLHMIFHKIGRMTCGDPFYSDNVVDIIGFATRLLEYLEEPPQG